jgi:hypothetical protein
MPDIIRARQIKLLLPFGRVTIKTTKNNMCWCRWGEIGTRALCGNIKLYSWYGNSILVTQKVKNTVVI